MPLNRTRSYVVYYCLIAFLAISIIMINLSTSGIISSIQTQKFLDEEIKYFSNIQNIANNNASIESITSSLQQGHGVVSILKALWMVLLVVGGGMMIGEFAFMYMYSKQELRENKYESHLN